MEWTPWDGGGGQIGTGHLAEDIAPSVGNLDQIVCALASHQEEKKISAGILEGLMKELFAEV